MKTLWIKFTALLCAVLLVLTLTGTNPLTRAAETRSQDVVTSSIATYASLRAINAFLSTAQEVEVGASFVASGSLQPLKALEPLDDTVERIASVVLTITMVMAVVVLGFGPIAAIGYALFLLGWGASLIRPKLAWAWESMRVGAMLGLVMPLVFVIGGVLGDLVTAQIFERHSALVTDIATDLGSSNIQQTEAATTTQHSSALSFDWLLGQMDAISSVGEDLSQYWEAAEAIVSRADELVESYVQIVGVYILASLLLPFILFGAFLMVLRPRQTAADG